MGPQEHFPSKTFDNLAIAFESYIKIMQLNGHGGALSNNKLKEIDSLKNLTKLNYLDLSNNQIKDICSLENLTLLWYLDLSKIGKVSCESRELLRGTSHQIRHPLQ